MSTNLKNHTAAGILSGISVVICAASAIITGVSGEYELAALMLGMMSLAILMMGVFMKSNASQCSEENAETTLE